MKQILINKLQQLNEEQTNLAQILGIVASSPEEYETLTDKLFDNSSSKTIDLLMVLLTTVTDQGVEINQQKDVIDNYQLQTQGAYTQLNRRKVRRMSFTSSEENLSPSAIFPSLSPKIGSLPSDFQRPLPPTRSLPSTPRIISPSISQNRFSDNFNPRDLSDVLEQINDEDKEQESLTDKIISLLQEEKKDLQKKIRDQTKTIDYLENKRIENEVEKSQLLTDNQTKTQKIKFLEREQKEADNDYIQLDNQNIELQHLLEQELINKEELAEKLRWQKEENQILKDNYQDITNNLEAHFQQLAKQEVDQLRQLMAQKEQQYEQERQIREQEFRNQLEQLKTQQIENQSNRSSSLFFLSRNASLVNTPVIPDVEEDPNINLFWEIVNNSQLTLQEMKDEESENSEIISNDSGENQDDIPNYYSDNLADYGLEEIINSPKIHPLDSGHSSPRKRISTSTIFTMNFGRNSPVVQEMEKNTNQVFDELINVVDDAVEEVNQVLSDETLNKLVEENTVLRSNSIALEKNWKELYDGKIEAERIIKELNAKLLVQEHEKTKIVEELNEKCYLLAETMAKQKNIQLELEKEIQELKEEKNKEIININDELDIALTEAEELNAYIVDLQTNYIK